VERFFRLSSMSDVEGQDNLSQQQRLQHGNQSTSRFLEQAPSLISPPSQILWKKSGLESMLSFVPSSFRADPLVNSISQTRLFLDSAFSEVVLDNSRAVRPITSSFIDGVRSLLYQVSQEHAVPIEITLRFIDHRDGHRRFGTEFMETCEVVGLKQSSPTVAFYTKPKEDDSGEFEIPFWLIVSLYNNFVRIRCRAPGVPKEEIDKIVKSIISHVWYFPLLFSFLF